ncbi:hypothetical protein CVT24_008587 [Panaeolus cyanescens]|uniref:Uncharacterized protein n=1 Tax=Panaeolus cyanescens TaxID=181874 RepID=A0A409W4B2_9AGAR|nr:hypothetical protein CVT24_008587 [Panaeolus cyanescens]
MFTIPIVLPLLVLFNNCHPTLSSPVSSHEGHNVPSPTTSLSTHAFTLSPNTNAFSQVPQALTIDAPPSLSTSQPLPSTNNLQQPSTVTIEPAKSKSTQPAFTPSIAMSLTKPLPPQSLLYPRQTTPATRQAPITIYGLYDAITNTRLAVQNAVAPGAAGLDSKKTGLAPLAEVFQVMTKQDPSMTGLPASISITPIPPPSPLETITTLSSPTESVSAMLSPLPTPTYSVIPPSFSSSISFARIYTLNQGVGLVSIPPSLASSLFSPTATASHTTSGISSTTPPPAINTSSQPHDPNPTDINDSNTTPPLPISKILILGCVIGGILFFTICILILFGSAGLCGFCKNTRKRRGSGKGIAGGLIYMPGSDKSKRGSYALAHAMANGMAVSHGLALPNGKLSREYEHPKSNENKFKNLMFSFFAFRSKNDSRDSSLHKSPSVTSYILGDKSRPSSRASRHGRGGETAELEGWTNLTPALLLGPVPVIQAHAQAHLEKRDRAREVVRGSGGGFDPAKEKGEFGVLEEDRERPVVQPGQQWNGQEQANGAKVETPQEIALQLLSTMKHGTKSGKKDKGRHSGGEPTAEPDARESGTKSKFSVCSDSQYSESSLSVIELYSSGDEDSDDELGKVSRLEERNLSITDGSAPPQLARCASARVLSLPPLAGGVQWDLPDLEQDSLASSLRVGETSGLTTSKNQVNDSPPSRPARPPRPPTADSPTLSESVYLACSEVAYVLKCAGGGVLSEGEAAGQDSNLLHSKQPPTDVKVDVSSSSAYSSSNPTANNSLVGNASNVNPIAPIAVTTTQPMRHNTSANDADKSGASNTSNASANTSTVSQTAANTSGSTAGSTVNSRIAKRTSRLLTGLASLTSSANASASSSGSLSKQEKSRSSLLLNESGEYDRSAERLALTRVPGAMSASDRFGDAGVSTMSYASYAQGQGYGHVAPQDARNSALNGLHQTPTRRPYHPPQTPPHSRSDGTISTEHARRSIQGYSSLLNHSNGYVQPHPYTYGPAAGYAYRPSRLSRIEGSPASITASAATGSVTAVGSSAATESSRASPTPSPGLLRSLSNTSASSSSTFDSKHVRTRSEPSKGHEDNIKAPRVSFNLATLQMQSNSKPSEVSGNSSGSQTVGQNSEAGKRGGGSPRSLGKPKKKRSQSYYHTDNEVDAGAESDIQEAIIRRIMKHRRSRSNSGWAYAGRGRR